jgi:tRNA A-37 threonylcarbamoyl transferase component Bud32
VSARHALLIEWGRGLFCLDLCSRTGTLGLPEGRSCGWLSPETEVQIGPHRLRLRIGSHQDPEAADDNAGPPLLHEDLLPADTSDVACLEFLDDEIRPREYQLKRVLTLVGRRAPCRIQLRDARVSRVHCALFLADGELWVIDLLGRDGTRVDGIPVRAAKLEPGQLLQIGRYRARVKSVGREPLPLAAADTDVITDMPTQEFIARLIDSHIVSAEELSSVMDSDGAAAAGTSQLQSALFRTGKLTTWALRQLRRNPVPDLLLARRYRLLEPLARGGMATVYRGLDTRLARPVAVKVVRKQNRQGGPLARQRLHREALIFAQLDHPHIVRVVDVDPRGRFAVFEYLEGESLLFRLQKSGRLPPAQVVGWMAQVADALDYAWERGIIHRDIKPSNILVTPDGAAKLLDFGLACLRDTGADGLSRHDRTVGTLSFMSPEQLRGATDLDTRTDIYAAGCTMYMLLSGAPPFAPAPVAEFVRRRLSEVVPAVAGVDPVLMDVLRKATAHDREQRYQTPAELRSALRDWQAHNMD